MIDSRLIDRYQLDANCFALAATAPVIVVIDVIYHNWCVLRIFSFLFCGTIMGLIDLKELGDVICLKGCRWRIVQENFLLRLKFDLSQGFSSEIFLEKTKTFQFKNRHEKKLPTNLTFHC